MLNTKQIGYIHQARKQANIPNDEAWRLLLWNTARVNSSKDLDNRGFEKVMAVLEEAGFRDRNHPGDYWRIKAASAGTVASAAAVRFIVRMAESSRYCLPALCEQFSQGRTQHVEKLTPQEAWKLTEMLKQSNQREGSRTQAKRNGAGDYERPSGKQDELFDRRAFSKPAIAPKPASVPCAVTEDEPPF